MKCTRCKKELIEGKNIYIDWHLPICKDCRKKIKDSFNNEGTFTKREITIAYKRLKIVENKI
jgi:hypothetical protein